MAKQLKRPPKDGDDLRRQVQLEHAVDSAAALTLLDSAAQALDTAIAAEAILKADGLTVDGTVGKRPHPCVAISRDARLRLVSALKALHLEL